MKKNHLTLSLWLTLGLGGLMVLLGLFPSMTEPLLQFDRARVVQGEWWRLLSGQLVHYGIYHLAMNVAALLLCGYVLLRDLSLPSYASLLLITAVGVGLGIQTLSPDLDFYAGLSGVLHGLIVAGLLLGLREAPIFNGIALLLLVGKLVQEQSADFDTSHALLPVPVAVDAHAYGAVAGLIFALVLLLINRLRTPKSPTTDAQ